MEAERAPVTKIESQIEKKTLVISTLGEFKSKVGALESASKKIQDAWLFTNRTAASTDSSKVTATATNAALEGTYSVKVAQTAQSETISIPGFTSASRVLNLQDFELTLAGFTYRPIDAEFTEPVEGFAENDKIIFKTNGGSEQTLTLEPLVSGQPLSATDVAEAINSASDDGLLEGVYAQIINDKLVLSTTNPLRGLTASFFNASDGSTTVAAAEQRTLSSTYTVSDLQDMVNLLDAGAVASLVRVDSGSYAISVVAKESGAGNLSFESATGAVDTGTYSLSYDGTSWTVLTNDGNLGATFDGTTFLATGSVNLSFDETPEAGNTFVFTASGVNNFRSHVMTFSGIETAPTVAQIDSINFSGKYAEGDSISVSVTDITGTSNYNYVVLSEDIVSTGENYDTYSNLATKIAALIAGGGPATASVSGRAVTLTANTPGTGFTATTSTTNGSSSSTGVSARESVIENYSAGSPDHTSVILQSGRDAYVSVNGLVVQRSSNQISDVITGVTISLNTPVTPGGGEIDSISDADTEFTNPALTATTLNVAVAAEDSSSSVFRAFVTAFNDLVDFYREKTLASADPQKRGTLANDPSVRSFMDRLKSLYSNGIRLADGGTLALGTIGVVLQVDGRLEIDETDFALAISDGLQSKLNNGVIMGYESATVNFTSYMTNALKKDGVVSSRITSVEDEQGRLENKVDELEEKLAIIQTRYYKQYAALDALLMRLQLVSNGLNSALSGLVGYQQK